MVNDTVPGFGFPAVGRKKVTAAFDGSRLTSDGGVMLLSLAERRLGIAERSARLIPDRRDPTRVIHSFADMIRARIFAICCGYEDADDLDTLGTNPAFNATAADKPGDDLLRGALDAGAQQCLDRRVRLLRISDQSSPNRHGRQTVVAPHRSDRADLELAPPATVPVLDMQGL